MRESFDLSDISSYGRRVLNVLIRKHQTTHDLGLLLLYVVRKGEVDLEKDLKECTNSFIQNEIQRWLTNNPDTFDLPMLHDQ